MFAKFIVRKNFGGLATQRGQMLLHTVVIQFDELLVVLIAERFIRADKHEMAEVHRWADITGHLPIEEYDFGGLAVLRIELNKC